MRLNFMCTSTVLLARAYSLQDRRDPEVCTPVTQRVQKDLSRFVPRLGSMNEPCFPLDIGYQVGGKRRYSAESFAYTYCTGSEVAYC